MDFKALLGSEVEIYKGKAAFKMRAGSYKCIDKTSSRQKLHFELINEEENFFAINLLNEKNDYMGSFTAILDDNRIKIKIQLKDNSYNRILFSVPSYKNEHFYGCGETYSKFDLKGEKLRIWVSEHQNTVQFSNKMIKERLFGPDSNRTDKLKKYEYNYVQPVCVSSDKYYIYVNTKEYAEFDFRDADRTKILMFNNEEITIGMAQSFDKLMALLTEQTGRLSPLPDWIYDGIILDIQRGVDEFKRKLARVEAVEMPVAAIWCQDWCGAEKADFGYVPKWDCHVDNKLYPNLRGEIVELHEKGIKFLGYVTPFISKSSIYYEEADANNYLIKDKRGRNYHVKIAISPAFMIDFTNPKAFKWYKEIIKENMIGLGMDGWIADFGDYLPVDCVLFDGSDPYVIHNSWPVLWAKLNREAIEETPGLNDILFCTRAAHTDSIKYTNMMWTGDQNVDWSKDYGLPSAVIASLSMGMSGFPISHSDIGGFASFLQNTRTDELFMRWAEMAAFSPLMRTHEGNQPDRNFQFDDDGIKQHLARMVRIHVKLGDYLKLLEREAREYGMPMMRPLFYHYDEEKAYKEKYEYLLGRDILVAPIVEEDELEREVYLPKDTWIQLFTGLVFTGGMISVRVPFGRPTVFVRAASPYKSEIMELQKVQ
ncbi:MAG: alpha-glucosidase [Butyrivibrio sp.]|nr:alpha-glucosidase [Butyrivibrio sp.]